MRSNVGYCVGGRWVEVATTDGSYESMDEGGKMKNKDWVHEGSVVVAVSPGNKPLD